MKRIAFGRALVTIGLFGLTACSGSDTQKDTDTGPIPPPPEETGDTDGQDTGKGTPKDPLSNRLTNPGFELGETWSRNQGGYVNQTWAKTGDSIHESSATFTAREGERALKIWGSYSGEVPNDSETGLSLTALTEGDTHTFTIEALTHADDALSAGNTATTFLRYFDGSGVEIVEYTSDIVIDETTEGSTWHTLTVEGTVPEGASTGALGLRFTLADWSAAGAVYLDNASWTSTGTGSVSDERLLVWQDEFDGSAIDTTKWTHELLGAYTYNNELQAYTDRAANSKVEDGHLVITARNESYKGAAYTSARLNTSGKAEWTYGRFESMLLVPAGQGTWPALWMLPTDWAYGDWPSSGEIDIMEHVGCDANVIHGTVHTGAYNHMYGTQVGGSVETWSATSEYHLYAIDWTEDRIAFSFDGVEYFSFENDGAGDSDTWPFDQLFHFVVNLAVGGDWGGYCGVDASAFPQEYRIDWIRVYQ